MFFEPTFIEEKRGMETRERTKGAWYRELYRLVSSLYPVLNEQLFERKLNRIAVHMETNPEQLHGGLNEEEERFYFSLQDVTQQLLSCYEERKRDCISEYIYIVLLSLQSKPANIRIPAL
jgi:hypothetical protein